MDNIDQILEKNYEQLDILKTELTNLKEIKNRIAVLIGSNDKLPLIFSERFNKIVDVTNEYTNILNESVKVFLDGNNELLTQNNTAFSNKITELGSEISRLVEVDFNALFKDLETKFLDNSKVELGKELMKFDEKINELDSEINRLVEVDFNTLFKDLETKFLDNSKLEIDKKLKQFDEKANNIQIKINDLKIETTRLSKIDLEDHFNKHQSKLSDVFISINGINGIISTISQNINKIIQNFGDIEQSLSKNQKEINKSFDVVKENQEKATNDLLNKLKESDAKLDAIASQNELLKKELDFNKKLNFASITLIIITIIILMVKG